MSNIRFNDLADAEDAYNALAAEVEAMRGIQAGMTTLFASLIAKHPNYQQFQLHLTSVVEIADLGSLGKALTPKERAVARAYVEHLQQIRESPAKISPLG